MPRLRGGARDAGRKPHVRAGQGHRRRAGRPGGRPLCILDLAVPRDVEPAVAQLENVFLYDLDDLQAVAAHGAAERRNDIPAAERIVTEEVERFWGWYGGLAVVPVLREFRDRMEAVRAAELDRTLRRLPHLSPEDRGQIEYFSQALLNKFLHQPTVALKEAARAGRGYGLLDALMHFAAFALVAESVAHPAKYHANNVVAGRVLLDATVAAGVRRVIFSSSCTIYGHRGAEPIGEDTPAAPVNPYGETKVEFERMLGAAARSHGVASVSLRYFNAAGASERYGEDHEP